MATQVANRNALQFSPLSPVRPPSMLYAILPRFLALPQYSSSKSLTSLKPPSKAIRNALLILALYTAPLAFGDF